MSRRFRHRDEEWEAEATGAGHGVGFGERPPSITSWGVTFRCLSNPAKGSYFGSIAKADVGQVSEQDLRKSLDTAIARAVLKALEDPRWDWRTVDGVAQETGLSEDEVLEIIESSPDEVLRSRTPDNRGRALYTSRRHYAKRRGFLDPFRST